MVYKFKDAEGTMEQTITLDDLSMGGGIYTITAENKTYYFVTVDRVEEIDKISLNLMTNRTNARNPFRDLIKDSYSTPQEAEETIRAGLALTYLFMDGYAAVEREELKGQCQIDYEARRTEMREKGYIALLRSNPRFTESSLDLLLDWSFEEAYQKFLQAKGK